MSTAIQRRRGTTAQHATFTGLAGEITVDTDKKTAVVHNGVTAGGTPLATETAVTAARAAADAARAVADAAVKSSELVAGLAGKANVDFNNITLTGKSNAGKAVAYALDYEHPVTFSIVVDSWVYAPVGGLMVGWVWIDPAAPADTGAVTVGSTSVAATAKNQGVNTVSCFIDTGVRVKKAVGMHAENIVIVPWRTA